MYVHKPNMQVGFLCSQQGGTHRRDVLVQIALGAPGLLAVVFLTKHEPSWGKAKTSGLLWCLWDLNNRKSYHSGDSVVGTRNSQIFSCCPEFMGAPHTFRLLGHRSGFILKFQPEAFPERNIEANTNVTLSSSRGTHFNKPGWIISS